ncbi:uncharacterized protein IL334_004076 [Kwoniella shivajii]|uniref:Chromo domain-containing protein n=1 Tax=Kwoniella shivajii TaxID=564305 RepID=A0ABZ1CZQ5_9TREE|nr:hypothetical protein IL334_004076 [Kwoniella shivajii]
MDTSDGTIDRSSPSPPAADQYLSDSQHNTDLSIENQIRIDEPMPSCSSTIPVAAHQNQYRSNTDKSSIGDDNDDPIFRTLIMIQEILQSNNDLIVSDTNRLINLAENTKMQLDQINQHIQKFEEGRERRKLNMKIQIDQAVHQALTNFLSVGEHQVPYNQNDTNASASNSRKEKGKEREKENGGNGAKRVGRREIQELAYPFFASTKSPDDQSESPTDNMELQDRTDKPEQSIDLESQRELPNVKSRRSYTKDTSKKVPKNAPVIDLTLSNDDEGDSEITITRTPKSLPTYRSKTSSSTGHRFPLESYQAQAQTTSCNSLLPRSHLIKSTPRRSGISGLTPPSRSTTNHGTSNSKSGVKRRFTSGSNSQPANRGEMSKRRSAFRRLDSLAEEEEELDSVVDRIIGKKEARLDPNGKKKYLYLIRKSGQPVSSCKWENKSDEQLDDKVFNLLQECGNHQINFRQKVVLLPEAREFWDNEGNRKETSKEKITDDGLCERSFSHAEVVLISVNR